MNEIVLDASALLALLKAEVGADVVAASLSRAVISTVNLSEVIAKLSETGIPEDAIRRAITDLRIDVRPFDEEQAYQAGLLYHQTHGAGISFGDRACLCLGKMLGAVVLTTDRIWVSLKIAVNVKLIR